MPRAFALLGLLVLAGCALRTQAGRSDAAPQHWRPSAAKEAWRITGHMDTERIPRGLGSRPRHEVVIAVNGAEALRGAMPRDRAVELAGRAEGSALAALCTPREIARATLEVTCIVLVDNERATTLTFTAGPRRPG
jgi:hypothetical protein